MTERRYPPGDVGPVRMLACFKASGMTERRYPPGDVGPVRMLADRPGLNARHLRA